MANKQSDTRVRILDGENTYLLSRKHVSNLLKDAGYALFETNTDIDKTWNTLTYSGGSWFNLVKDLREYEVVDASTDIHGVSDDSWDSLKKRGTYDVAYSVLTDRGQPLDAKDMSEGKKALWTRSIYDLVDVSHISRPIEITSTDLFDEWTENKVALTPEEIQELRVQRGRFKKAAEETLGAALTLLETARARSKKGLERKSCCPVR